MADDKVLEITDVNFESLVVNSDVPVLVDFWAPWCGPCQKVGPIIAELAKKYEGKAKVGKVNVDESQETAIKLGISSIPAVFLFKGGEVVENRIGASPKSEYEKMIDRHL